MNSSLILVHVLTCLFAVFFFTADGQDTTCCPTESCCSNNCAAPSPYNISLFEMIAGQPLYVNILPAIPLFAGVDGICYTFIPLPDGTYLLSISIEYSNGFNVTEELITNQQSTGVFGVGSASCNAQFTIFDYLDNGDCSLFLGYACFNYGDCSFAPGNDNPVFGLSYNATAVSQDCLDSFSNLTSDNGVNNQGYFIVPYNLTTNCVTQIPCSINSTALG